jgi:hypothetical protein
MEEVWRDIVGYERLYQVSNWGRVKSLPRNGTIKEERILKPRVTKNGYLYVHFRNGNISKYVKIHRLVAEAFIPNPENKPQVNHINGNKLDNRVDNLEWNTASENTMHAFKLGLFTITRDSKGRIISTKNKDTQ